MENPLALLALLACPLGMGLMMWMMMGMNKRQALGSMPAPGNGAANHPPGATGADDRLGQLLGQLGELQAQQAAIAAQIERLSVEDEPAAAAPGEPAAPSTGRVERSAR